MGRRSGSFPSLGIPSGGLWRDMRAAYCIAKASLTRLSQWCVRKIPLDIHHTRNANIEQNFTTFASPHLGVRTPLRGWHNHIWNVLGARTLSASGRQLFTIDNFRDTGKPLLEVLAEPDSIFIKGLACFERRTLYANIVNDRSAVYYTTGISKTDPYTKLDKLKMNYVKGYEDVVLDPDQPIAPADPEETDMTFYGAMLRNTQTTIGRLPIFCALAFFIPIAVVAFLINSGVQSLRSNRRIKLHERGLAGIQPGNYRVPLLITGMREVVEDVYENLNSTQDNEYLVAGTEEDAAEGPSSPPQTPKKSNGTANGNCLEKAQSACKHDVPTLALAPYQFRMVQALDAVGWRKYPVWIHKVRHSHAAIIVRTLKDSFSEGKLVIKHWLDEEFLL